MSSEPLIHALLVEDDRRLASLTSAYLERHGVVVTAVYDGDRGLAEALRGRFDVVLLDVMLPGRSGTEICQRLREHSDVPIIMITARGEEADRVLGLELGADDYVPKPFSPRELLARIRAQIRRARGAAGPRRMGLRVGELELDPGALCAVLAGRRLELTAYELALLHALASSAGRVLTREQLMERARGSAEEAFDRSVDVHISRLRQKLGDDERQLICTVRGAGYLFAASPEQRAG
ncbi:MAG: response regulator transcription factor [Deltaproteobacteria bacterium]|nr:response regulator transcription factor [Deltaproteobacteria bacterium]